MVNWSSSIEKPSLEICRPTRMMDEAGAIVQAPVLSEPKWCGFPICDK
jgi:hypothetical protein